VDETTTPAPSIEIPVVTVTAWHRRTDLAALALLVALFTVWQTADGGSRVDGSIALAIVAVVTAALSAATAWRNLGSFRTAWAVIAAGCAIWAAGVLSFARTADQTGLSGRFIPLHLGWTGLTAALAAGILLLGLPETGADARRKLLLDLTPTVIALVAGVWLAVFGPSAIDAGASWRLRAAAAVHGIGALVLLIIAFAGALRRSRAADRTVVRTLSLAAATLAIADLVWLQPWMGGRTDRPLLPQIGFLIGFLAVARAAARERDTAVEISTDDPIERAPVGDDRLQLVPHLSLFGLLVLAWVQSRFGDLQPAGTETAVAGSLAVVVFVILRQGLALRHARTLKGEIGLLTEQIDGLIQQVGRDPLTGLLNRRAMIGRIDHELAHGRTFGHPLAVVLIDVDNFKTVNDALGHQAGDRVLLAVGSILNAACRGTDVAARYAGDEFVLVLPGLDERVAGQVCERIVDDVRRLADELNLGGIRVTLSVGAAITHRCKRTAAQMIAIADAAMYDAKESGKDRVAAVDADTLLPPGVALSETAETAADLTYLPTAVVRALGERRRRAQVERAS
jgi:diguanylate cyclase (GGDEF)-like protein